MSFCVVQNVFCIKLFLGYIYVSCSITPLMEQQFVHISQDLKIVEIQDPYLYV